MIIIRTEKILPRRHGGHREKFSIGKIFCVCFLLIAISGLARAELFVHQLQHLSASNAIPSIQPHLSKESTLTSKGFQLFLSGSEKDNLKLKEILKAIDVKLGEYLVEVKILNQQMDAHQFNSTINKLEPRKKIKRLQLDDKNTTNTYFNLRMTENYQAFIATGESFPEHKVVAQYGHLIPSSTREKVSSGFYMLVQSNSSSSSDSYSDSQEITVRVSAQEQQVIKGDNSIGSSSTSTKFSGVKDKWILIASNAKQRKATLNKRFSTNSQSGRSNKERWYYVRISDANTNNMNEQ